MSKLQPYISDLYAPELTFKDRLDTVGNERDMTAGNTSTALFTGTGNSGEAFVPEPKKVLCKEIACSIANDIANDASTCCIATCDSIENGVAFCNEIGVEGGLVDNAAMIQCKGTACTSKLMGCDAVSLRVGNMLLLQCALL